MHTSLTAEISSSIACLVNVNGTCSSRPYVTVTYAQSVDGCIAGIKGQPLVLSGAESMRFTHWLRSQHQGILCGVGTIISDNPRLNVRLVNGSSPTPIIIDSGLDTPTQATVIDNKHTVIIICNNRQLTTEEQPHTPVVCTRENIDRLTINWLRQSSKFSRLSALVARGCSVLVLPCVSSTSSHISLCTAISCLSPYIDSLMIEGGAAILDSVFSELMTAGWIDQVIITITPTMIGGGTRAITHLLPGSGSPRVFPRLHNVLYEQHGEDIIVRGTITHRGNIDTRRLTQRHTCRHRLLQWLPSFSHPQMYIGAVALFTLSLTLSLASRLVSPKQPVSNTSAGRGQPLHSSTASFLLSFTHNLPRPLLSVSALLSLLLLLCRSSSRTDPGSKTEARRRQDGPHTDSISPTTPATVLLSLGNSHPHPTEQLSIVQPTLTPTSTTIGGLVSSGPLAPSSTGVRLARFKQQKQWREVDTDRETQTDRQQEE